MVKGNASPDDPRLTEYWKTRRKHKAHALAWKQRVPWQRQQGRCLTCGGPLDNDEAMDKHHVTARCRGGDDRVENQCLIHTVCHQQRHRQDPDSRKPRSDTPTAWGVCGANSQARLGRGVGRLSFWRCATYSSRPTRCGAFCSPVDT
ncbi:MAG: HNH endonuclease [Myxococcota bacterium]